MTELTEKEMKDAMKSVKIESKEFAFWTDAKFKLENSILQYTESLIGDKAMLEIAIRRIDEEKKKFENAPKSNR